MESEPMFTPKEKSLSPEKKKFSPEEDRTHEHQARGSWHQAGQRAQHTTNELFWPPDQTLKAINTIVPSSPSCPSPLFLASYRRHEHRHDKLYTQSLPGSNPASAGIFSGSSHTSDLNIGTPVATLPGAWRYRVSTGNGRPGVSIL